MFTGMLYMYTKDCSQIKTSIIYKDLIVWSKTGPFNVNQSG